MHVGCVTEDKVENDNLIAQGHKHIIFTYRAKMSGDFCQVDQTNSFYQVNNRMDAPTGELQIQSFHIPYSYNSCRANGSFFPILELGIV